MGNEQSSGKHPHYVVKYPPQFNELHFKVDNGLAFFKDELSAAARTRRARGIRPANVIKERAKVRRKLKAWAHELNRMEKIKLDALAEKKKWDERDFERWQEMLDGLKKALMQCKKLVDTHAEELSAKKPDDPRETAEDFLRGDGLPDSHTAAHANKAGGGNSFSGGQLRTGKLSAPEQQAMQEIRERDAVVDGQLDQVVENTEYLLLLGEMMRDEIEAQTTLVGEMNPRTEGLQDRTRDVNTDVKRTMGKDGFEEGKTTKRMKRNKKEPRPKRRSGSGLKAAVAKAAVKGVLNSLS
jgi:hypothetical protein